MGKRSYWFPAKRWGWGWGFPSSWQGWATFALYFGALWLSAYVFPPGERTAWFILTTVLITAALLIVSWIRGEPAKWRWGKR